MGCIAGNGLWGAGHPTMTVADMSRVQNRIYKNSMPFPVFKLADLGERVAHISEVDMHIDQQREEATKAMY